MTPYSITVAAKMKKMTEDQRLLAEMLVNEVLYYGISGKLTESADITILQPQMSTGYQV